MSFAPPVPIVDGARGGGGGRHVRKKKIKLKKDLGLLK